jgi:FeS assembly SUF system protein
MIGSNMFWRKREEQPAKEAPEQNGAPEIEPAAQPAEGMIATAEPEAAAPSVAEPATADAESGGGFARDPDIGLAQLEGRIIAAISEVYDPEIPVNIYEMGLIYDLDITADHCVRVQMTLTSPACPVAGSLPGEVEAKIREVDGVNDVALELVWDPPWTPDRMSEAAKLELGFM